jgi:hypothetical protein
MVSQEQFWHFALGVGVLLPVMTILVLPQLGHVCGQAVIALFSLF